MAEAFHELSRCLLKDHVSVTQIGHAAINVDAHPHQIVRPMLPARGGVYHAAEAGVEVACFPVFSGHRGFELSDSFPELDFLGSVLAHLVPESPEQRTANKTWLEQRGPGVCLIFHGSY